MIEALGLALWMFQAGYAAYLIALWAYEHLEKHDKHKEGVIK